MLSFACKGSLGEEERREAEEWVGKRGG